MKCLDVRVIHLPQRRLHLLKILMTYFTDRHHFLGKMVLFVKEQVKYIYQGSCSLYSSQRVIVHFLICEKGAEYSV